MPIRGAGDDLDGLRSRARSSNGGSSSGRPSCARVTPSAWQSRPGPAAEEPRVVVAAPRRASRRARASARARGRAPRWRVPSLLADEVQAPVDAVRAVDVGAAGRAEHGRVPRGPAAVAVARRVLVVVRLDLDDAPADAVDEQGRAEQLGRDLVHAAREEGVQRAAPATRVVADERGTARATIEGTRDAREAARDDREAQARQRGDDPASTLPSAGVAATCASSIPETRPRSWSGVTVQRIVAAQHGADVVGGAGDREQQQREPEARPRARSRDRDAPEPGRDGDDEALAPDVPDPAGERATAASAPAYGAA